MTREITNEEIITRIDQLNVELKMKKEDLKTCNEIMKGFILDSINYIEEMIKTYESQLRVRGVGRPSIGVPKRMSVTLPQDQWDSVEEHLSITGISLSAYIRSLIQDDLGIERN